MKLGAVLHMYEHTGVAQLAKPNVIGLTGVLLLTYVGCMHCGDDWHIFRVKALSVLAGKSERNMLR